MRAEIMRRDIRVRRAINIGVCRELFSRHELELLIEYHVTQVT